MAMNWEDMTKQFQSSASGILAAAKSNAVTAYQKNLQKPLEEKKEQKQLTKRYALGRISEIQKTNPAEAQKLKAQLDFLERQPSSAMYNPNLFPTNPAVGSLERQGFSPLSISNPLTEFNNWMQKPGKNAMQIASQFGRVGEAEPLTRQAEQEQAALREEISYWTGRGDLNLSDDQIAGNIKWDKYPTLNRIRASIGNGENRAKPLELNRGIDASDDWLYATIWANRNGGGTGNILTDMANSALNVGNVWQADETAQQKTNPLDKVNYNPNAVGCTLDEEGLYFGLPSFDQRWVSAHRDMANSQDATEREMYNRVAEAEERTQQAESQIKSLDAQVDEWVRAGIPEDKIMERLDALYNSGEYDVLRQMDSDRRAGGKTPLTRAVDYRMEDVQLRIHQACAKRDAEPSAELSLMATTGETTGNQPVVGESASALSKTREANISGMISDMAATGMDRLLTANEQKNFSRVPGSVYATPGAQAGDDALAAWGKTVMQKSKEMVASVPAMITSAATEKKTMTYRQVYADNMVEVCGWDDNEATKTQATLKYNEMMTQLGEDKYLAMSEDPEDSEEDFIFDGKVFHVKYGAGNDILTNQGTDFGVIEVYDEDGNYMSRGDLFNLYSSEDFAEIRSKAGAMYNDAITMHERIADAKTRILEEDITDEDRELYDKIKALKGQIWKCNYYSEQHADSHKKAQEAMDWYNQSMNLWMSNVEKYATKLESEGDVKAAAVLRESQLEWTRAQTILASTDYFTQDINATPWGDNWTDLALYTKFFGRPINETFDPEEFQNHAEYIDKMLWYLDYVEDYYGGGDYYGDGTHYITTLPKKVLDNMKAERRILEREKKAYEYYLMAEDPEVVSEGRRLLAAKEAGDIQALTDVRHKQGMSDLGAQFGREMQENLWGLPDEDDLLPQDTYMGPVSYRSLLSDEEKMLYYGIYAVKGRDAAYAYYDFLTDKHDGVIGARVNGRYREIADQMQESGKFWAFVGDAASVVFAPVEAINGGIYYIDSLLNGMNGNSPHMWADSFSKETYAHNVEEIDNHEGWSPVMKTIAKGLYSITYNGLRSSANALTFGGSLGHPIVSAMPMSIGAGAGAAAEAKRRGATDEQAWIIGIVTTASEAITEGIRMKHIQKYFENFGKPSAWKALLADLIPDQFAEMTGETINDITEFFADVFVMGDKSQMQEKIDDYAMQGAKDPVASAWANEIGEWVFTGVTSFFSPIFHSAPGIAFNAHHYASQRTSRARAMTAESLNGILGGDYYDQKKVGKMNKELRHEEILLPEPTSTNQSIRVIEPQWKDYFADRDLLDRAAGATEQAARALAMSTVLTTDEQAESADMAAAAYVALKDLLGQDVDEVAVIRRILDGARVGETDTTLVKSALNIAALSAVSQSRQVFQSEEYQNARPTVQASMLAAAAVADAANQQVQQEVEAAVHENRINEAQKALMADENDQTLRVQREALKKSQQEATEADKRVNDAEQMLSQQEGVYQAKTDALQAAISEQAKNAADHALADAVISATKAVERAAAVREEYRKSVENAKTAQESARQAMEQAQNNYMTESRKQAEQIVAEQEQAQKEAREERERINQEQAEEILRQQAVNDMRSGATQEAESDERIADLVRRTGLEGEEADQLRDRFTQIRDQLESGVYDMSGMVTSEEAAKFLGKISRVLNAPIQVVETENNVNGYYQNGTIYLSDKLTMGQAALEAAMHEVTHLLEQTQSYEQYAKLAMEQMYDSPEKMQAALDAILEKYKESGHELTDDEDGREDGRHLTKYDKAQRELVAEFTRTQLTKKDVVQRMVDNGVGGTIRNALHNINQYLKNLTLSGEERKQAEYLRKAERLFQKMINEQKMTDVHPDERQFSLQQFAQANHMYFDPETMELYDKPGGTRITEVTPDMIKGTPMGMLIDIAENGLQNKKGANVMRATITPETAAKQREMFAGLMTMVANYKDSDLVWEIAGSTMFSALKGNSDPQYSTTVDFGTVCAKTQEIIEILSETMLRKGRGLTRSEVLMAYDETAKANLTVPCPVCYVFSRWMGVPSLLGQMDKYQEKYVALNEDGTINAEETQKRVDSFLQNALDKYGDPKKINSVKTKLLGKQAKLDTERARAVRIINSETATDEEKAEAKATHDRVLQEIQELDEQIGEVDAYNWITQALCTQDENGNYVVDPEFRYTPKEVLFNLNRTGEFAKDYAKNWKYRNTRGAGMGKAIMPYSGMEIGDIVHGTTRWSADQNPFQSLGRAAAGKAMKAAIERARKQNLIGGQRLQSTSDFRPEWGLDYMMSFLEMQAIGSNVQMYTKVAEAVDLLASMRADVNLSIMGKGSGWHLATEEELANMTEEQKKKSTINGQVYVLDFSDVTGMDYTTAKTLKDQYDNVQMILVGMNDTHIKLAMMSDDIDFIIPWHSSGNSKDVLSSMISSVGENLETNSDYTDTQTDKASENQTEEQKALWNLRMKILTGAKMNESERAQALGDDYLKVLYRRFKEEGVDDKCYKVKLKKDQAGQIFPYEYWDKSLTKDNASMNGQAFIDYCQHFGIVPRFSGTVKHNDDGTISVTGNFAGAVYDDKGNIVGYDASQMEEGYWKVLIDRPMYNNDGTYREQETVDVTQAKIGRLENGKLTDSDMPLQTSAKYGTKYSEQAEQAVQNTLARIDKQYDLKGDFSVTEGTEQETEGDDTQYSVDGNDNNNTTDADIIQALINEGALSDEAARRALNQMSGQQGQTGPETGQRQFGYINAQQLDSLHQTVKNYLKSNSTYVKDTNGRQVADAIKWIASQGTEYDPDGYRAAVNAVTSEGFDFRSADGQARMLTVMAMAATRNNGLNGGDVDAQVRIADAFNRQGTILGQALQARKLMRLMTPIGRVAALESLTESINRNLHDQGRDTTIRLSRETLDEAARARDEEEFRQARIHAMQELAEQIPVNWKDRLQSLRIASMLANPRTHIRNILGNFWFMPLVSAKNKYGAVLERMNPKLKKGDYTKTLSVKVDKEVRQFALDDADSTAIKDILTGQAKYSEMSQVMQQVKMFGRKDTAISKTLGKAIQAIIDFNSWALEREDWIFLKGHYARALGGWMDANGFTPEQLRQDTDLLDKGRAYAINEAQKATYRDANKIAQQLNNIVREKGAVGFLVNAVLPFRRTPANILRRGIEYSPVGLLKTLALDRSKVSKYMKWQEEQQNGVVTEMPKKAMSPQQFIDSVAAGVSGTVVTAIGAALSAMGALRVRMRKPEEEFDKLEGAQEYALEVELFGHNISYTIDWMAPASMPLFIGASVQEVLSDGAGIDDIGNLMNSIMMIAEPVFNLSMLDGLNSTLTSRSYDDTPVLSQIGAKILANYVTSYIPSAVGALSRTIDPTRRRAFVPSDKNQDITGVFLTAFEQAQNKTPWSVYNIPYRNAWGEEQRKSEWFRAFENFINPGYLSEIKPDELDEEMKALYQRTGESSVIPKMPNKSFDGEALSAEQYDMLTVERGQIAKNALTELIHSDYWNSDQIDDAERAEMVSEVWEFANAKGKEKIGVGGEIKAWIDGSNNPAQTIIERSQSRLQSEYIDGHHRAMFEAMEDGKADDVQTSIAALREAGRTDKQIKDKIANTYRDQYKAAYLKDDKTRMEEIKEMLGYTGYDFDFEKWEKDAKKNAE